MRKKFILFSMLLTICGILLIPAVVSATNIIQAFIVDYDIDYYGTVNYKLANPLISYNDNTYISLRDMATLLNKDIIWDNERQSVKIKSFGKKQSIINSDETALSIGKAIILEYYEENVNENTVYDVSYTKVTSIECDDEWWVSAIFEPQEKVDKTYILTHPDVRVEINSTTGNFGIIEFLPNGTNKTIVERIHE